MGTDGALSKRSEPFQITEHAAANSSSFLVDVISDTGSGQTFLA